MPLKITIPDEKLESFNRQAEQQLVKLATSYCQQIIAEAGRIEQSIRSTGGRPEITSSIVNDASIILSRSYRIKRKPTWFYLVKILAIVFLVVTGYLIERLNENWGPVSFAISVVLTTILVTIQTLNE